MKIIHKAGSDRLPQDLIDEVTSDWKARKEDEPELRKIDVYMDVLQAYKDSKDESLRLHEKYKAVCSELEDVSEDWQLLNVEICSLMEKNDDLESDLDEAFDYREKTKANWIDINDEYPKSGQTILVKGVGFSCFGQTWCVGGDPDVADIACFGRHDEEPKPTHWAEIPKGWIEELKKGG